jgi:hypothetical protein
MDDALCDATMREAPFISFDRSTDPSTDYRRTSFGYTIPLMDPSDIPKQSDEELMKMVADHMPGSIGSEAAKTELELRSLRKMTAFAASIEKSGRRIGFAAWAILAATLVQLVIMAVQIVHGR